MNWIRQLFHCHAWSTIDRRPITLHQKFTNIQTGEEFKDVHRGIAIIERCSNPECFKERAYADFGTFKRKLTPDFVRHSEEVAE